MVIHHLGQPPSRKFHLPWWALFLSGIVCFVVINVVLRSLLVPDTPATPGTEAFFVLDLAGIGLLLGFWMAGIMALARQLIAQR